MQVGAVSMAMPMPYVYNTNRVDRASMNKIEPIEDDVKEVEAWVMEGSKGKYLHMNSTEDGDGTWFDWTENMFDAYWDKSLDDLKDIAETEFSDFEENYPKYHKVRFTAEVLETAQAD